MKNLPGDFFEGFCHKAAEVAHIFMEGEGAMREEIIEGMAKYIV